jgi:hypothetical protein
MGSPEKMNRAPSTTTMADARRKGIYRIYSAYKDMGYEVSYRPDVKASYQCDICKNENVTYSIVFDGCNAYYWLFAVHDTCAPDIVCSAQSGPAQMTLRGLAQIHHGFAIIGLTMRSFSCDKSRYVENCSVCERALNKSISYYSDSYNSHCGPICTQCDQELIRAKQQATHNLQTAAVYKAWILGPLGDTRIIIAQFLCCFLTEADVWEAAAVLLPA